MSDDATLLLSVRPRYAERILSGAKTVELRRVRPLVRPGTRALLYVSSPTMALLASAIIRRVDIASPGTMWPRVRLSAGVTRTEYNDYFRGAASAIAIWLDDIRTFTRAISLAEIRQRWPWLQPPQSFRFVDAAMDDERKEVLGLAPSVLLPGRARGAA